MWNYLIQINKNLIYAIPVMLLAGFSFGAAVDPAITTSLKYLIVPLTFLMVYPMMVTLNIKHLKQGLNLKLQGAPSSLTSVSSRSLRTCSESSFSRVSPPWRWGSCSRPCSRPAG